ncbi:hypothetical protein PBAL39_02805 [Pedobacter sp. BAL39]|nr:hypothetical protein PBAL39_02805 [Pedobacter sp. BAL39]
MGSPSEHSSKLYIAERINKLCAEIKTPSLHKNEITNLDIQLRSKHNP